MSPLQRDNNEYVHLEVIREPEFEPERKRQRPHPPQPPVPSDRSQHGKGIAENITQAVQEEMEILNKQGIDPSRLLVLEFNSINIDLRETLEARFQAWVVDEQKSKHQGQQCYRFLVQFSNQNSIEAFKEEIELYKVESPITSSLPKGLRLSFFDGLQNIGIPSYEDRIGVRLKQEGFPTKEFFYLDVDLWHPGDTNAARQVLTELRRLCNQYNGRLKEELRTSSLLLAKVYCNKVLAEILLKMPFVARVDLPPYLQTAYSKIREVTLPRQINLPSEDDPTVCIVDSGVIAGHPLLMNWVIEERDFDTGENTVVDLNGHGTAVAGIVVYGNIASCIENDTWEPKVRVCSAKVLRHEEDPLNPDLGNAVFPDEYRIERVVEEAIRYFAQERKCRIFNLSLGNALEIYNGGRQFAWAEKLDELARELDVVMVVSSGNRTEPPTPDGVYTREQFQQAVRNQLLSEEHRICNPATSALAMTVGAIARADALGEPQEDMGIRLRDAFAGSPKNSPSPFTRTGLGYTFDLTKSAIKPDVVDYGGNYALQVIAGGSPRWVKGHILLGEPTITKEISGRYVGTMTGTSFACPHISHAAAIATKSLESALGRVPSANLVRALVGSATVLPKCSLDWPEEEKMLQLIGYGICSTEDLVWSKTNRVRLIAMDEIGEDKLHIYQVKVPTEFLTLPGKRGITVALAYDPPVRGSRKEYLARTMWFELLHGLTLEEVEKYRAKYSGKDSSNLPSGVKIDLSPSKSKTQWSTLQVRKKEWSRQPKLKIVEGETEAIIHLLVGCQHRFPTGLDTKQKYGLVVLFWHENEQIKLYQLLRSQVRIPAVRVRVER